MKILRKHVSREEVVRFYVGYDCAKKDKPPPTDIDKWDWNDARALERNLGAIGLKPDVTPAYISWCFVCLSYQDLRDCAIVNSVKEFEGHQPVLSILVDQGLIPNWSPPRKTNWFDALMKGADFPPEWALVIRPSTKTENPAKWYVDDGTGRALGLLRSYLCGRRSTADAFAYLGVQPDRNSTFLNSRHELLKPWTLAVSLNPELPPSE